MQDRRKRAEGRLEAGQFYTRREFAEQQRKGLARGEVQPWGAEHGSARDVEYGGGDFRYVTLAVFRGDGRRRDELAIPLDNSA